MPIEVWEKRPFNPPHIKHRYLTLFLHEGQAFATWETRTQRVKPSRRLPVSDELIQQHHDVQRFDCPYVGQLPAIEGPFECQPSGIEGNSTYLHCGECGWSKLCSDSSGDLIHGEHTRLAGYMHLNSTIYAALWDRDSQKLVPKLTLPRQDEPRLVILPSKIPSRRRAKRIFPELELASLEEGFIVLQTDPNRPSVSR